MCLVVRLASPRRARARRRRVSVARARRPRRRRARRARRGATRGQRASSRVVDVAPRGRLFRRKKVEKISRTRARVPTPSIRRRDLTVIYRISKISSTPPRTRNPVAYDPRRAPRGRARAAQSRAATDHARRATTRASLPSARARATNDARRARRRTDGRAVASPTILVKDGATRRRP